MAGITAGQKYKNAIKTLEGMYPNEVKNVETYSKMKLVFKFSKDDLNNALEVIKNTLGDDFRFIETLDDHPEWSVCKAIIAYGKAGYGDFFYERF